MELPKTKDVEVRINAAPIPHNVWAAAQRDSENNVASIRLAPNPRVRIALAQPTPGAYKLTAEENEKFLHVIAACAQITTHYELFLLMQGEMQFFLPQDILIAAWGDFLAQDPHMDVISGLPGVRTDSMCDVIVPMAKRLHSLWINGGSQPIVPDMKTAERRMCEVAACAKPCTLPHMHLTLVHGTSNKRDGHDSLYIALSRSPHALNGTSERLRALADLVIHQIDVAYRKVATLHITRLAAGQCPPSIILSIREEEITYWVCQGKTNSEIAQILGISVNTVKNHVHRIFDKLGASNRTQAVAKYKNMNTRSNLNSNGNKQASNGST